MTEFVEVPCTDCEEPVEMPAPTCAECMGIEDMELPAHSDIERVKPESDLRELVEEWRDASDLERLEDLEDEFSDELLSGLYGGFRQCADDLEALIE